MCWEVIVQSCLADFSRIEVWELHNLRRVDDKHHPTSAVHVVRSLEFHFWNSVFAIDQDDEELQQRKVGGSVVGVGGSVWLWSDVRTRRRLRGVQYTCMLSVGEG